MLDFIINQTMDFLETMPKLTRKKKGQFFTSKETAVFMASLFDFSNIPDIIEILDPGAGTGILSAALLDRIIHERPVKAVNLTCYENDPAVLPILKKNLMYIKEHSDILCNVTIVEDDYIVPQAGDFEGTLLAERQPKKYDVIIGNPPYVRVPRNHPAALAMPSVVHGAPNLYFLFAAMSLFNLQEEGEMVYIIPRSWTSGEYFRRFRTYLLKYGKIVQIHLFVSRDKVFKQEQVLQETLIIKVQKTAKTPDTVKITSTESNSDFKSITGITVPYGTVVAGERLYVYLPTSEEDVAVIQTIHRYERTMPDEGLQMHTGIVVDFRQKDELENEPGEHTVPLFYSQNIKSGRVDHRPSGNSYDWIRDVKPGLIQKNQNYVFCKRFTAKEEYRRLQCGIYLAKDFPDYQFIGTQNKINYISRIDQSEMSTCLTFGVYALLNSTLFDRYYRILNGSTQVNSTEINSIPVPPIAMIEAMGRELMTVENLSTETCDKIIKGVAYGE